MKNIWSDYAFRRALSAGLAVLAALALTDYLEMLSAGWAVIAAFLVCQTSRGTPLRQGMIIFFCMLAALFISILLHACLNLSAGLALLGGLMVLGAYGAGMYYPFTRARFVLMALFPVLVLIAALQPYHYTLTNDQRFLACIIGTLTGMAITLLIVPASLQREFSKGLCPLLEALATFAKSMRIYPGRKAFNLQLPDKISVERALLGNGNAYPEWVFEVGFNPGLRSGFRYVLVNLDYVIESLFSLSSYFNHQMNPELMEKLTAEFNESLKKNAELFSLLAGWFRDKSVPVIEGDFTRDITELETALKSQVPASLELIDLSPDYLSLSAIVRDIKELRQKLLHLIAALPA